MLEDSEWNALLEASLLVVLEAADEGVIVFDRESRCRMVGRRAGELFGVDPAGFVGKARADVLRALSRGTDEPEVFLQTVGVQDLLDPPRVAGEIEVTRPKPRRVVWTTFPVVRQGTVVGRLVLLRDVTRERSAERVQKQLQARIDQLTPFDMLTGLTNQRRFREELEREHGRATRAWDSYAILRADVDDMRVINDEFGEPVGDSVLEKIAGCLTKCRREYDILARLEADEFVALLPGADAVAAQSVADRYVAAIDAHAFHLRGRTVSICVGCAVWMPPSAERGDDILRRAGLAMQRARAGGKGRVLIDAPST